VSTALISSKWGALQDKTKPSHSDCCWRIESSVGAKGQLCIHGDLSIQPRKLIACSLVYTIHACPEEAAVLCRIRPKQATVIAAGAWTPQLASMASSAEADGPADVDIQPRKGHLLELPASLAPAVKHGLMEIGYAKV